MTTTKTSLERAREIYFKWIGKTRTPGDEDLLFELIAQAIEDAERRGMERVLGTWPSWNDIEEKLNAIELEYGFEQSERAACMEQYLRSEIEKRLNTDKKPDWRDKPEGYCDISGVKLDV